MIFVVTSLILFVLAQPCIADQALQEGPFGITMNPTTIIASRINASGIVDLTTYPATKEYISYYEDIAQRFDPQDQPNVYVDEAAISMFRTAFDPVTQDLTQKLGHPPKYSALVYPAIFKHPSWRAAWTAITTPLDDDDDRPVKMADRARAACAGYDLFNRCDLIGRASQDCNEDGPTNLILGVEYEQGYMHIGIFEMVFEWQGYAPVDRQFCRECGLRFNHETEIIADYEERVRVSLESFIQRYLARYDYYSVDDIRAAVVVGDVPPTMMAKLEDLLQHIFKVHHVRMLKEIDSALVSSHGAASYALHTQVDPEAYVVYIYPVEEAKHEEL